MPTKRGAKSVAIRALIALCVGVVATGGAGWGIALWEQRKEGVYANPDGALGWSGAPKFKRPLSEYTLVLGVIAGAPTVREERDKIGVRYTVFMSGMFMPTEDRLWQFGWPVPCLGMHETASAAYLRGTYRPKRPSAWANGWEVELGRSGKWVLPLRVWWGAAALDVVAWIAAAAALMFGAPAIRAWLRRRRGRCGACGYDRVGLGVDATCPECGVGPTSPR